LWRRIINSVENIQSPCARHGVRGMAALRPHSLGAKEKGGKKPPFRKIPISRTSRAVAATRRSGGCHTGSGGHAGNRSANTQASSDACTRAGSTRAGSPSSGSGSSASTTCSRTRPSAFELRKLNAFLLRHLLAEANDRPSPHLRTDDFHSGAAERSPRLRSRRRNRGSQQHCDRK